MGHKHRAAIVKDRPALTTEYKLNLLSLALGARLICRARVVKLGRQVSAVAADVFPRHRRRGKARHDRAGIDCDDRRKLAPKTMSPA